jgi:hypothetical protein
MKFKFHGQEIEIDDNTLKDALEKQTEVELPKPQSLIIRTNEEEEAYKNNLRNEAKQTGVEVTIKEYRDKLGLSFDGKNMDAFTEAYKKKILDDAKIEPDTKVKALESDMEKLRANIQTIQSEKEKVENQFQSFKTGMQIQTEIGAIIPANTVIPKDDMLTIIKNKYDFKIENGKTVVVQNGEILKNPTTLEPLAPKDAIDRFFMDNPTYINKGAGGAGGGDSSTGGGKISIEKFIEEMQGKSIQPNSEAFNNELNARIKAGTIEM